MEAKKYNINVSNIILSALGAVSLIILQDLIALTVIDLAALISLIALAVAIPFIASSFLINFEEEATKEITGFLDIIRIIVNLGAFFGTITGITTALWRMSWVIGVVFLASSVPAYIV